MKAKKSLGQNFLVDHNIVTRIVDRVLVNQDELVLEIGPGHGVLTQALIEQAAWVVAVEIDESLVTELEANFSDRNLTIVSADVLDLDIVELIKSHSNLHPELKNKVRVVANLPYYISTAILSRLIQARSVVKDMTLMLQREVAERIASPPGSKDYGVLSVIAQMYCQTKILFHVKPGSFRPVPKVESSILRLEVYEQPSNVIVDDALLIKIVNGAFSQRRKTILNSLKATCNTIDPKLFPEDIAELLKLANIAPERRAETLSCQEFAHLTEIFFQKLNQSL